MANAMQVFMRTNEFNNGPRYSNQATFEIEGAADTLALIVGAACQTADVARRIPVFQGG